MRTPGELLDMPVERSARWLALRFLDEAEAAHGRMENPDDAEALHDFRVALRRLRSTVRAYERHLGDSLGKKDQRRLRRLARATGGARDAEVHIDWLQARMDSLGPDERFGAAWMLDELREEKERAEKALRKEVSKDFAKERWRLTKQLKFYRTEVSIDQPAGGPVLAAVLGRLVREAALEAERHLQRVDSIHDQDEAHEARIAGKRLRYLLEPFADEVEGGPEAIKRLKKLQDVLGDMHDADVMIAQVRAAIEEMGGDADRDADGRKDGDAEDRDPRPSNDADANDSPPPKRETGDADSADAGEIVVGVPDARVGLRKLIAVLERERAGLFQTLKERWLGERTAPFFAEFRELGRRVAASGQANQEIERKFLLRRMPRLEGEVEVREIDQGWLPGERLAERLRRVRWKDGTERYYRTVKLGAGTTRFELEEETTRDVFRRLWLLTRGKRVRKLRYRVKDGDFTWEIDRFRGRRLVLAEVEIPTEDTEVEPPGWLRRLIVREVTGEPEYVNINLAR